MKSHQHVYVCVYYLLFHSISQLFTFLVDKKVLVLWFVHGSSGDAGCVMCVCGERFNILKMTAASDAPDPLLALLPRANLTPSPLTPSLFQTQLV